MQVRGEVTVQEYLQAGGRQIQVNIFITPIPGGFEFSLTVAVHLFGRGLFESQGSQI